jgi:ketosteroid isomerase-like protein
MEHDAIYAAYKSYNERDIDALLELMCEDVDWSNALTGDRIKGHAEMRKVWLLQWTSLNPQTEPLDIYEDAEGRTVVLVREILREVGGRLLMDQEMEQVFTFRDGLVARMDFRHVAPKAAETIDITVSGE